MFKKVILISFLLFCSGLSSNAEERFNASVTYDYEKMESEPILKIKKNLPALEKEFIDLNYSIEYKALDVLSEKEEVIRPEISNLKFVSNPSPESYEVSLSTGKTQGVVDVSTKLGALLKKNPNDKELLFAYAIQLKNEGNPENALIIADRVVALDPDFALGHFLRGDILRNLERFKESVEEYLYTTQINPYCADAYYNIAKILELLDDKELALDYYKTAYEINPTDSEIRDIILEHYIDL